jgi:hypothetical protein
MITIRADRGDDPMILTLARAPGLREAWDAGDVTPFHGWARRATRSET